MVWKVYFWIYFIITLIGIVIVLPQLGEFNIWDLFSSLINIIFVIGLYAFAYSKKVFDVKLWKIIFYITMLYFTLDVIDLFILPLEFFHTKALSVSRGAAIFSWLMSAPIVYSIYKLGFSKK